MILHELDGIVVKSQTGKSFGMAYSKGMIKVPNPSRIGFKYELNPALILRDKSGTKVISSLVIDVFVLGLLRKRGCFYPPNMHHVYLDCYLLLRDLGFEGFWSLN